MTPFFYSLKKKREYWYSLYLSFATFFSSFPLREPFPIQTLNSLPLSSPPFSTCAGKKDATLQRGFFSKRKDREVVPIAFGIEVFVICGLWKPTDPMLGGRGSTPSLLPSKSAK
jgi:hypothetical protein